MRLHTDLAPWDRLPALVVRARTTTLATMADWSAWAGLAVLLLVAPFERIDARLVLPGQTITNVEAVLLAALAAWVLALAGSSRTPIWRTAFTAPALLLLAVLTIAALVAPAHRENAFRFVGRFGAGMAVCLLAANAAATTRRVIGLLGVAVGGGTAVGCIVLLEAARLPEVLSYLTGFRESAHVVGGAWRMSGTLQYPTIASMYLEIVFALGLPLLVLAVDRRATRLSVLVFAALAVMAEAVVLTLTRAGLVALAIALLVATGGLIVRRGFDRATRALVALAGVVIVCSVMTLSTRSMWVRLTTESPDRWYRAAYQVPLTLQAQAGEWQRVPVTVRNDGLVVWRSDETPPFYLSYHWLDDTGGQVVQFDGARSEFPVAVEPGESVTVLAAVRMPPRPGAYRLAWDIVQEHFLWFSTENSPSAITRVETYSSTSAVGPPLATIAAPAANLRLGRFRLWRIAVGMLAARPLLGFGPDNFRLLYGEHAGIERADRRVHTNNMYFEMFVGAGVAGGLLFIWLLWRIVAPLRRAYSRSDGSHLVVTLGVAAAVATVLVHGLVDSFLTFTPTYVLIWAVFGVGTALSRQTGGPADADRV